jgi:hypothetical protein
VSRPVSIRLDRVLIEDLRKIARKWSFERNRDIAWPEALEAAIRMLIRAEKVVPNRNGEKA